MNPKWLMGIVLLYLILGLWNGIIEGSYLSGNETSTLDTLLRQDPLDYSSIDAAVTTSFNVGSTIIGAFWTMFTWDFAQFDGQFGVFRLVLIALSIGVVFAIVLSLGRGVSS